jgi:sec-independent protein translocase protein TatB
MFDIGWSELLLIGIVALIAIGPKELPAALRTLGQWTGKLRRMASEFQNQFHEAMREAEMADLKKQVDELTSQAKGYADFDPIGDVRKELESTQRQIESTIAEQAAAAAPVSPPAAALPEAQVGADAAPAIGAPDASSSAPLEPAATGPAGEQVGGRPA